MNNDWPDSWKKEGWNHVFHVAIEALEFLAKNPPPRLTYGQSRFNAEHLYQISTELKKSLPFFVYKDNSDLSKKISELLSDLNYESLEKDGFTDPSPTASTLDARMYGYVKGMNYVIDQIKKLIE